MVRDGRAVQVSEGFGRVYGKPQAQLLATRRAQLEGREFVVILTGAGFAVAGIGDECPAGDVVWSVKPEDVDDVLGQHGENWELLLIALGRP